MYEAHFGFSGPPFQLNPDPSFYFNSRGHGHALAYLRYGAAQGEGFIVVTGEIGAGKTTLVRTLLDELDRAKIVSAQIVSTQLAEGELLQAILSAYGIPSQGTSKASLLATLEAFLMALATQGRRALLIVDEAQNLQTKVIEELRMLSNFQLGTHALMQSFLVGQPELRKKLESPDLEQLRQRVTASCHLGPLDVAETQAYVAHRLRRVGWDEKRPHFSDATFREIHRWSGGVPRRINRLCNRLLLAAFLENSDDITAELAQRTALDLRQEIGESFEPLPPEQAQDAAADAPVVASSGPAAVQPVAESAPSQPVELPKATPVVTSVPTSAVAPEVVEPQTHVPAPVGAAAAQGGVEDAPAEALDLDLEVPEAAAAEPEVELTAVPDELPTDTLPEVVEAAADSGIDASPAVDSAEVLAAAATAEATVDDQAYQAALTAISVDEAAPLDVVRTQNLVLKRGYGVLLCLADTASGALKCAAIAKALAAVDGAPRLLLVNPGMQADVWPWDEMESILPALEVGLHLGVPSGPFETTAPMLFERLGEVVKEFAPLGLLSLGNSEAILACSLMVQKRGIPVVRIEAGDRQGSAESSLNALLIEQIADVLFATNVPASHRTLHRLGVMPERVHGVVGRLAHDVQAAVEPAMTTPYGAFLRHKLPMFLGPRWSTQVDGTAYAVVALEATTPERVQALMDVLLEVYAVPKLIWLVDDATRRSIEAWMQAHSEQADRVFVIPDSKLSRSDIDRRNGASVLCSRVTNLPDQFSILRGAVCLISQHAQLLADVADGLDVPSLILEGRRLTVLDRGHLPVDQVWGAIVVNEKIAQLVARSQSRLSQQKSEAETDPMRLTLPRSSQPRLSPAQSIAERLQGWVTVRQVAHRANTGGVPASLSVQPDA